MCFIVNILLVYHNLLAILDVDGAWLESRDAAACKVKDKVLKVLKVLKVFKIITKFLNKKLSRKIAN